LAYIVASIDVPCQETYPVAFMVSGTVLKIPTPGAKMLTEFSPQLEKIGRLPVSSIAPIDITLLLNV